MFKFLSDTRSPRNIVLNAPVDTKEEDFNFSKFILAALKPPGAEYFIDEKALQYIVDTVTENGFKKGIIVIMLWEINQYYEFSSDQIKSFKDSGTYLFGNTAFHFNRGTVSLKWEDDRVLVIHFRSSKNNREVKIRIEIPVDKNTYFS